MDKRFLPWLMLIWLAGCNFPPVAPAVATPSTIFNLPANATLQPTFTPIPTITPVEPSETPLIPTTLAPSTNITRPDPMTPAAQPAVTPQEGSPQGSVVLQGGICCVGGVVGTNVNLRKDFFAPSSFGPVIEMHRKEGMQCFSEVEMANAPWEPYTPSVTELYMITTINWVGHFISVQYRDNLGNLSPVVCDDISVEGMPALPTPGL